MYNVWALASGPAGRSTLASRSCGSGERACSIYIHTYIHTFIHSHIHTFIPSRIHNFIPSYLHTFIHSYVHTYRRTHSRRRASAGCLFVVVCLIILLVAYYTLLFVGISSFIFVMFLRKRRVCAVPKRRPFSRGQNPVEHRRNGSVPRAGWQHKILFAHPQSHAVRKDPSFI